MKAILTLDEMPDVCGNCYLFDVNNDTDMREICVPKYWHTNIDEKPDWCPLKELPERDDLPDWILKGTLDYTPDDTEHTEQQLAYSIGYNHGWNACLNAVENGEGE